MTADFLLNISPIFVFILFGYLGKKLGYIDLDAGKKLVKFLFFVPLPILVFISFASTKFTSEMIKFPIISAVITLALLGIGYLVGKMVKFPPKTLGAFLAICSIPSTLLFALPVIATYYGSENSIYLFLYDLGDGLLTWTLIYLVVSRFGNKKDVPLSKGIKSFAKNPMIIALIGGITFSILGLGIPDYFVTLNSKISAFVSPLLLIAVGIFLDFSFFSKVKNIGKLLLSSTIKMGVSLLAGIALVNLFGISGVQKEIVLIASMCPAASLSVAFSAENDLDVDFASAAVAFTIVLGMILTPILIYVM